MTSSSCARPRAIDFHAHIIVPEVYALAAQHNIFSELPTDPGVTDDMRKSIKARAATVLARMSDLTERLVNMDAMGVDVQVLSASLVHQGLEWADAQTSLHLARTTNDWIAKAVAAHPILTEFLQTEHAINAIYPHRHHLSAKVRSFIDLLVKHFHEDPGWADACRSRLAANPAVNATVVADAPPVGALEVAADGVARRHY